MTISVSTDEAAAILKFSPRTVESWRKRGLGPRYFRNHENNIRYLVADLETWLLFYQDTLSLDKRRRRRIY